MDIRKRALTNIELMVIVEAEIEQAMGQNNADAMNRYMGAPLGNEIEGRSQVVSRDVLETVEWILPTILEIFVSGPAMEFEPDNPEDVQQAKDEAEYLNYIFYKKNNGFLNAYTWIKDALISKNGIIKAMLEDESETYKETYHNLLGIELQALLSDDRVEIVKRTDHKEMLTLDDSGAQIPVVLHDVEISYTEEGLEIELDVIAPEEHLISNDAASINPHDARFNAHLTSKTISEVREMGYTDEEIGQMEIGESKVEFSAERIARLNLAGEQRWDSSATLNTGMRQVKIYECITYVDMDGDGFAERIKVFKSGEFLDWEEIDYHPIHAITPVILTHKFQGLSIDDLIGDLQNIRTSLLRSYLDNITQTINGKTFYDTNKVNVDDMLTNLPYGNVEVDGSVSDAVFIDRPGGLPAESYTINDLLDRLLTNRIGDYKSQLDPNVLAQANTGVVLEMLNEAKGKVFMIARIFAEVGFKPLFRTMHHLARKKGNTDETVMIKDKWITVNPSEWRDRRNMSVRVGLGHKTTKEEIAYYSELVAKQQDYIMQGIPVCTPENLYNTLVAMTESMGKASEVHWTHPSKVPEKPKEADPSAEILKLTAQVEGAKVQQKDREAQTKAANDRLKIQLESAQLQLKAAEARSKDEVEKLKLELASMKEINTQERAQLEMMLNERSKMLENHSQAVSQQISADNEQNKLALQQYVADLNAEVSLMKEMLTARPETDTGVQQLIISLMDRIEALDNKISSDEMDVEYDDHGRIVRMGSKVVNRGDDGRITRISRQS